MVKIVVNDEKVKKESLTKQRLIVPEAIDKKMKEGRTVDEIRKKDMWDLSDSKKYIRENRKKLFDKDKKYKILTVFSRGIKAPREGMFKGDKEPIFYTEKEDYNDPVVDDKILGYVVYEMKSPK